MRPPALGAVLLAVGVQIQVTLPIGGTGLRLNAADPLVACLAALLLAAALNGRGVRLRWRVPAVPAYAGLLTAVVLLSLVVGRMHLGEWHGWAVLNRAVGWPVLLAYGLAGAWVSTRLGEAGQRLFVKVLLGSATVILTVDGLPNLAAAFSVPIPLRLQDWEMAGAMGNSNALAFFILVALAAFLPMQASERPLVSSRAATFVLFVLLLSLWYTASRGGWLAGVILIAAAALLRVVPWRALLVAIAATAVAAFGPEVLDLAVRHLFGSDMFMVIRDATPGHSIGTLADLMSAGGTDDTANIERLMLTREALALWREHMVLGTGLGGFLAQQIGLHNQAMIIHNTGLWILTEMGMVGAAAFAAVFAVLLRAFWPRPGKEGRRPPAIHAAAFLALIGFAAMSLTHEVLYQRILWLLLGMALALPAAASAPMGADPGSESMDGTAAGADLEAEARSDLR